MHKLYGIFFSLSFLINPALYSDFKFKTYSLIYSKIDPTKTLEFNRLYQTFINEFNNRTFVNEIFDTNTKLEQDKEIHDEKEKSAIIWNDIERR